MAQHDVVEESPSPDGQVLVYGVESHSLWLLNPTTWDRTFHMQLPSDIYLRSPFVSADNQFLYAIAFPSQAYRFGVVSHVIQVNLVTREVRYLYEGVNLWAVHPFVDDNHIQLDTLPPNQRVPSAAAAPLCILDISTQACDSVYSPVENVINGSLRYWLHSHEVLSFRQDSGSLLHIDVDTSQVTETPILTSWDIDVFSTLPDRNALLLAGSPTYGTESLGPARFLELDLDTLALQEVTDQPEPYLRFHSLAISPDGRYLWYSGRAGIDPGIESRLVDLETRHEIGEYHFDGEWLRDSSGLLVEMHLDDGNVMVAKVNVPSGDIVPRYQFEEDVQIFVLN